MIEAVRNFLQIFVEETPAEKCSPQRLAMLLDRLLIAYHETDDVGPATDSRPPPNDYKQTRALVESRFPDFGFYAWAGPEENPNSEVMMGDAIDDLADIYGDLRDVVWLWENSSAADATWQFRFGYQTHWGRHLLDLRSYLHWKLHEV